MVQIKMLIFLVLILGIHINAQTTPRIWRIGDIEAMDLFKSPDDITDPTSPWNGPLTPSKQAPQSHRTLYTCFMGPNIANPLTVNSIVPVILAGTITAAINFNIRLEHPFLEMDPWACAAVGGVDPSVTGDCRCNNPLSDAAGLHGPTGNIQIAFAVPAVANARASSTFVIPAATYFEHAPYPGQNPYMRTYRKMCIQSPDDAVSGIYRDTTIWIAVVHCCTTSADCTVNGVASLLGEGADFGGVDRTVLASYTPAPVALSYSFTPNIALAVFNLMSDNTLDSKWKCNREGYLGAFFNYRTFGNIAAVPAALTGDSQDCWGETSEMTVARQQRSVCCGAAAVLLPGVTSRRGTCINPATEACCGWKAYNPKFEQCCSKRTVTAGTATGGVRINYIDQNCRCTVDTQLNDCQFYGPNIAANMLTTDSAAVAETSGNTPIVKNNRQCCVITKYPEFNTLYAGASATVTINAIQKYGVCYDTTSPTVRCCDDGHIFDIGAQQCCAINGVQSLNTPCPCNKQSDCVVPLPVSTIASSQFPPTIVAPISDSQASANMQCCIQQWPPTWLQGQGPNALDPTVNTPILPIVAETNITGQPVQTADILTTDNQIWPLFVASFYTQPTSHCNKYSNWPDGQGPAEVQRCLGRCIDTRFQTCCNGQVCVKDYERCCNSTCCNRFTSGCMEGTRSGALGFGSRINPNDYNIPFESCTSIEIFTTRRAFWVWVMPTFWTIATVVSLAVVVVVSRRATENFFPLTERCMIFFAVVLIGLCVPHYFAPTYKYGIVVVFTSMFAIIGAAMNSKKMSLVTVLLVLLMLGLWFDPFDGNIYLSLPGGFSPTNTVPRNTRTSPDYYAGILEALFNYERHKEECTGFYDYFQNDPAIHDFGRFYNPAKTTFGFCTRAWMSTLLIFSIIALACLLVLLVLSVFSLAKKLLPKSIKEDMAYELPLDAVPMY